MKNSMCYFCSVLFLLLMLGSNTSAQESTSSMHFSLFGGIALPQGDFGGTEKDNDKAGFANTGFCAMIEGSKNLNESVMWVSSLSFALNSLDESAIQNPYGGDFKATAGSYLTSWAMTGIGFETAISPTINGYGVGQIGLLISNVPDVEVSSADYHYSEKFTTKMGTSFAYGFGAGVIINKFNIGLRYYTGKPEYEQTVTDSYHSSGTTEKFQMPATVLQLLVGITL